MLILDMVQTEVTIQENIEAFEKSNKNLTSRS